MKRLVPTSTYQPPNFINAGSEVLRSLASPAKPPPPEDRNTRPGDQAELQRCIIITILSSSTDGRPEYGSGRDGKPRTMQKRLNHGFQHYHSMGWSRGSRTYDDLVADRHEKARIQSKVQAVGELRQIPGDDAISTHDEHLRSRGH